MITLFDIYDALDRQISLPDLLRAKARLYGGPDER